MPDLEVGDAMPDVTLTGPNGPVKLRDHIGKPLVVYFYPADDTYGCTIEACAFRDQYEDFTAAGAEVIGISRDDASSHAGFKANHKLPFTLLSDTDGSVATQWGVKKTFGLIPGRVTFVFDKAGVCKSRFESQIRVGKHVDEALALVKKLAA
jgi:thioredoxin-dependent peroxiredoxin